jgi:hypothetical protein
MWAAFRGPQGRIPHLPDGGDDNKLLEDNPPDYARLASVAFYEIIKWGGWKMNEPNRKTEVFVTAITRI